MEKAKTNGQSGKDDVAKTDDSVKGAEAKTADNKPTPPVRRTPGVKEVIPFEWKLIGEANGLALTLFKSVEREDAEAQLARLADQGYYKDLRILNAGAPVPQRAAPAARIPVHKVPSAAKKKTAKSKKRAASAKKREHVVVAKLKPKHPDAPPKAKTKARAKPTVTKKAASTKTRKKKTAKKK